MPLRRRRRRRCCLCQLIPMCSTSPSRYLHTLFRPWSVVCGPWSVVRGPWSVVRGLWSVVRVN